jgi:hypothetical protein
MIETPFHRGEIAMQERAGARTEAAAGGRTIRDDVPPVAARFLAEQRWLVVAGSDDQGRRWASLLPGEPGFARALDRHVDVDATPLPGDPLLGPGRPGPGEPVGMLALEPRTRRRMRVNGRVASSPPALRVAVREVFANCPRYIRRRDLVPMSRPAPPVPVHADALDDRQRRRLAEADTFFLATGHDDGCDASHRGGTPGFLTSSAPELLTFPDYAGNSMFQTLGNLLLDPRIGLTVPDLASGTVLMLSGRAEIDFDGPRIGAYPGAHRLVDMTVDAVVELAGALPLTGDTGEPSPVNPVPGRLA